MHASDNLGCSRRFPCAVAAVVAAGFLVRLYVSVQAFSSTFDTATPGVMALHILKGARPLFYYGQDYMGALEAYVAAGLFTVLGPSLTALSLSPILFSLGWILATYGLFRDLAGRRAGLGAALCVALPGWDTLWYNVGSYGGYPAALFFGTLALWLSLRIARGGLSRRASWGHTLLLGLSAGLALWTHFICAAYLAVGVLLVVFHLLRSRFAPAELVKLAAGAVLLIAGALPLLRGFAGGAGDLADWVPAPGRVRQNLLVLARRCAPSFFSWPAYHRAGFAAAAFAVAATAGLLYAIRVLASKDRAEAARLLLPVLVGAAFLGLYLPHRLAHLGAPRYAIPLFTTAFCAVFSLPLTFGGPWLRRGAGVLLALWLTYNGVGAVLTARQAAPEKRRKVAERGRVVENALRTGANTVKMVGGPFFGHEGQILTFYAADRVRFVSVFDDRYQPAAQAAESDPHGALACEGSKLGKVENALRDLGVAYSLIADKAISLIHDLNVPPPLGPSLAPAEMRVFGLGPVSGGRFAALDRIHETSLQGPFDPPSGLLIDLGRPATLRGLWLVAPDWLQFGLPEGYEISTSLDGRTFEPVRATSDRIAAAYVCGPQVYMKGYFAHLECRLEPVTTRVVRILCNEGQGRQGRWVISEVFLFGDEAPAETCGDGEIASLAAAIRSEKVDFTIADRWLSARLIEELGTEGGPPPAFPRFNPKYADTRISRRVVPREGLALAAERCVADECEALLTERYGQHVIGARHDFPHYSLFVLRPDPRSDGSSVALVWNGRTLLRTFGPPGELY